MTANYKWEKSDFLGSGAFGRVYKGTEIKSGKNVAIKTFEYTLDVYLNREADTLAMANHTNVVRFFGLEKPADYIAWKKVLIMEYCSEGNLFDLIKSKPNGLESMEFLRVFKHIVDAVKHLRDLQLVHRDIKPSNILISKSIDGQNVYKLADFGAARILREDEEFGSLYGTNEYIHPDIFLKFYSSAIGIRPTTQWFTANHELWSLGVTFYESATGQLPFVPKKGRNDPNTMYQMTAKKQQNDISARQVGKDDKIVWSQELPSNCSIEDAMKRKITPFLAGLLSVSFF